MTAINIFLQRKRAIVMTDALFIDMRSGDPLMFQGKCEQAPGTKMVVAARGDYRVPDGVAEGLSALYSDIDTLIADEGLKVRDIYDQWVFRMGGDPTYAAVEIYIVGWSDHLAKPRAVLLHFNGAWATTEIGAEGISGPLISDLEFGRLRSQCIDLERMEVDDLDPIKHGIPLMEAQRRMKLPVGRNRVHCVGGHILMTEVTADGCFQNIVHEWPDEEGEAIHPAPFVDAPASEVPPSTEGMSRQQRRAWERVYGGAAA